MHPNTIPQIPRLSANREARTLRFCVLTSLHGQYGLTNTDASFQRIVALVTMISAPARALLLYSCFP
jgi:hypothetical protein